MDRVISPPGWGRRSGWRAASAILLLGLALRLVYLFTAPVGIGFGNGTRGSDDEMAHLNYIRKLATLGRIPVQHDSVKSPGAFERNEFEYYQPPLYYALGALLYKSVSPRELEEEIRWMRFLSLALAMGQLAVAWPILRAAFPVREHAQTALFVAATLGAPIKATTFVGNDPLIFFLMTWGFLLIAVPGRVPGRAERFPSRREALLFLVLALAAWTKASALLLALFALGAGAARARTARDARPLARAAAVVLAGIVAAAPWYLRNLRVYGDALALSVGAGPDFAYPVTAGYILPRLAHVPYELFYGWYLERPGRIFPLLTMIEYAWLAAALALAAWTLASPGRLGGGGRSSASQPGGGIEVSGASGGSVLALCLAFLLVNGLGWAGYAATSGYFGPRQMLGALAGLAALLALPAIRAGDALGRIAPHRGPGGIGVFASVSPLVAAALVTLPKHLIFIAGRLLPPGR